MKYCVALAAPELVVMYEIMNKELELHDSTLAEVRQNGSSITLCLDKAIVHHSEGEPGVDSGTCWLQKIDIFLDDATFFKRSGVTIP